MLQMRELLEQLQEWRTAGVRAALARVVDTDGSGPRDPGAAMAVSESGQVIGSVSGGCVEGAVVGEGLEVLDAGIGRVVTFGYSDDDAFAVGLTCGGTVQLYIEPFDPPAVDGAPAPTDLFGQLQQLIGEHRPAVLATVIEATNPAVVGAKLLATPGPPGAPAAPGRRGETTGTLGSRELDRIVARDALGELDAGTTSVRHYGPDGEAGERAVTIFIESFAPPPRLFIFGAIDFTAALCRVAKVLGFHVTVCDARATFATAARFPLADEVIVDWPHRLLEGLTTPLTGRDAVCVLTHDNKFDVPAIMAALDSGVGYLGALGSRRTADGRHQQLIAAGATPDQLMALHAPIGLDLGGRSPEETAISIAAEIIALRNGRTSSSLRNTGGPIHG